MNYLFLLPINRIPLHPNWSPPPARTTVTNPRLDVNSTILPGWFPSAFPPPFPLTSLNDHVKLRAQRFPFPSPYLENYDECDYAT
jgi:hypothetical protein